MPISKTAACTLSSSSKTVAGRPSSLLWLPSDRRVRYLADRTAAIKSLVVVLPTLPVTPTVSGENRCR